MEGRTPRELEVYDFADRDPFDGLTDSPQLRYVRSYLADLSAKTVVEEPYYFDRDYLAEFSSFYSTSAVGYPNVCRRLHFFSSEFSRELVTQAAKENVRSNAGSLKRIGDDRNNDIKKNDHAFVDIEGRMMSML